MVRYFLLMLCGTSLLWAAPPQPSPCSLPSIQGNNATLDWDGTMSAALRQEEYSYYNKVYQLQAQLKSAMLKYAMLQEQEMPEISQLQQSVQEINNIRLQMDMAAVNLEQQVRSVLPRDQYRQWRAGWQPASGYEWSLFSSSDPNDAVQAMALWQIIQKVVQGLGGARANCQSQPTTPQNYLQQLPAQSMQRALQFSAS